MPFKEVIICEKMTQAQIFKEIFGLKQKKSFHGFDALFYDHENGIAVCSQSGHLLQQSPPQHYEKRLLNGWNMEALPVIPTQWRIEVKKSDKPNLQNRVYALLEGIEFALVKNGTPGAISIAADNDKEGELLGWEVLDYFNLMNHPHIYRLIYSELGVDSMRFAYETKQPGSVWFNRYLAGLARARSDWLIGMNVTMALSLANKKMVPRRFVMNAGRVIFAMVHILHLRHLEVVSYVKTDYFGVRGKFAAADASNKAIYPFQATLSLRDEWLQDAPGGKRLLIDPKKAKELSDACVGANPYTVKTYQTKRMAKKPPIGFARTPFDSWMIKYHSLSLEEIANALQSLYSEKALITYPRVESDKLDMGMHASMPKYVEAIKSNILNSQTLPAEIKSHYEKIFALVDLTRVSSIFEEGINVGESHHAIIPTANRGSLDTLSEAEKLVYFELADRLLMQFLADYEYNSTSVTLVSGGFEFTAKGTTPLIDGWRVFDRSVQSGESDPEGEGEENSKIPPLNVGDQLLLTATELVARQTPKPQYYTNFEFLEVLASPKRFVKNKELMSRIKTLQIGTGNTRSSHVSELPKRGLVIEQSEKKGKGAVIRLLPTHKMLALAEIGPEYFKYPEMSAFWEDCFNNIQDGKLSFEQFMSRQEGLVRRFTSECTAGQFQLKTPLGRAETCKNGDCKGFVFRMLSAKSHKHYWACNTCDTAYGDRDGEMGSAFADTESTSHLPKKDCPECFQKSSVAASSKTSQSTGKPFLLWVCRSCNKAFFDNNGEIGKPLADKRPAGDKKAGSKSAGTKASGKKKGPAAAA